MGKVDLVAGYTVEGVDYANNKPKQLRLNRAKNKADLTKIPEADRKYYANLKDLPDAGQSDNGFSLDKLRNFNKKVDVELNASDHAFLYLGGTGVKPHTAPLEDNKSIQKDAKGFLTECGTKGLGQACD